MSIDFICPRNQRNKLAHPSAEIIPVVIIFRIGTLLVPRGSALSQFPFHKIATGRWTDSTGNQQCCAVYREPARQFRLIPQVTNNVVQLTARQPASLD